MTSMTSLLPSPSAPAGAGDPPAALRLMAVHAHPDDESSKGAATSAHYAAAGVEVLVVSCTGGERGDILNTKLAEHPRARRDLAQLRREEMAAAAEVLGVAHTWLGYVDSGLPEGDPTPPLPPGCFGLTPVETAAQALTWLVRTFKPHVMTTYDENGGYPHPDHIMCHKVSVAAFEAAGDPQRWPELAGGAPPWQPLKLYYNGFSRDRMTAVHQHFLDTTGSSPFEEWIKRWDARPAREVHTHVTVSDSFGKRDAALLAHASQIDPDGHWFRLGRDVETQLWPTEDFELATSLVPVSTPEDDLFAGVREHLAAPASLEASGV